MKILLAILLLLTGCATKPASQKILDDYNHFVQTLDSAVENGEIDPTQALVVEQQIKYQAMYAYQYQKQIEEQQRAQSIAYLGALGAAMNQPQPSQPVVYQNNSTTCYTPAGSQYSYCN